MIAIEDKEELLEYCKGDKIMEEYARETIELNNDDEFKDILTREQDERIVMESAMLYARDEGELNKQLEIAKNLLEMNIDIKTISKATGLSIEEIESIM